MRTPSNAATASAVAYLPSAHSTPVKQRARKRLPSTIVDARARFEAKRFAANLEFVTTQVAKLMPAIMATRERRWSRELIEARKAVEMAAATLNRHATQHGWR